MLRQVYRYDDPTGGGDDAFLVLPEWAKPKNKLIFEDNDGFFHDFEFVGEIDPDEMIEEADL